ncbi:MAG: glycosyltransferase family 4 protein [Bacteroidetes bacterium]|nr:glycosyltransferase family 4 protein [Bacteroidota bacterium]
MSGPFGIGLLCTTRSLGGIELNVLRLAGWMRERGHHCLVVGTENAPLLEKATEMQLPTWSLGRPPKYGALGAARKLAAVLTTHHISTLILNVTRDLNLGVLTRMVSHRTLHLVHTQHMQFGGKKTDLLHRLQHAQLDAWIAPLPWLAEQTREYTTVPPERIHIIPFGIDLGMFDRMPEQAAVRTAINIPQSAFVAGVVGRLDRGKGQEYLIRATARLRERARNVHALIVGEETRGEQQEYGRELQSLVEQLDIPDRVHFRGFLEHVEDAYAAMDCFALTSLSETYGMVTIEAMAAGLPVIATASAGTPELISDGKTGFLVPPRDPAALAEQIEALENDASLGKRIGTAARRESHTRFSHHMQCERIEDLLEQICAS